MTEKLHILRQSFQCHVWSFALIHIKSQMWASLMAQEVNNPLVMQETQKTWVWSLSWDDTLEEGMTTHSSILAWRIPWTEEPGRLSSIGSQSWTQQYRLSIQHKSQIQARVRIVVGFIIFRPWPCSCRVYTCWFVLDRVLHLYMCFMSSSWVLAWGVGSLVSCWF